MHRSFWRYNKAFPMLALLGILTLLVLRFPHEVTRDFLARQWVWLAFTIAANIFIARILIVAAQKLYRRPDPPDLLPFYRSAARFSAFCLTAGFIFAALGLIAPEATNRLTTRAIHGALYILDPAAYSKLREREDAAQRPPPSTEQPATH